LTDAEPSNGLRIGATTALGNGDGQSFSGALRQRDDRSCAALNNSAHDFALKISAVDTQKSAAGADFPVSPQTVMNLEAGVLDADPAQRRQDELAKLD
jgi:hypothetical protein